MGMKIGTGAAWGTYQKEENELLKCDKYYFQTLLYTQRREDRGLKESKVTQLWGSRGRTLNYAPPLTASWLGQGLVWWSSGTTLGWSSTGWREVVAWCDSGQANLSETRFPKCKIDNILSHCWRIKGKYFINCINKVFFLAFKSSSLQKQQHTKALQHNSKEGFPRK